tara:strand:+ start:1337 stop:2131 length:795 start_codon:yes stop_codon:yes gene_type:complete
MKNKDKFSIENKIILVVGGSGQIGENLINFLITKKTKIINFDLIDSLKNLKTKKNYFFYKVDLKNHESIKKNLANIKNKFKKIDILINLAHYKGDRKLKPFHSFFSEFHNYPDDLWKKNIDINLTSTFIITKEVLKIMLKNKKGTILNFSSTYGLVSPNYNIYGNSGINSPIGYTTTKSAIINFTKYIATHYGKKNIRANCISPGGIKNKNQSKKFVNEYTKLTPLGRLANPDEFNESVLFLISDASSYMTGSNLIIDGGWTSW